MREASSTSTENNPRIASPGEATVTATEETAKTEEKAKEFMAVTMKNTVEAVETVSAVTEEIRSIPETTALNLRVTSAVITNKATAETTSRTADKGITTTRKPVSML